MSDGVNKCTFAAWAALKTPYDQLPKSGLAQRTFDEFGEMFVSDLMPLINERFQAKAGSVDRRDAEIEFWGKLEDCAVALAEQLCARNEIRKAA